MTGDGQNDGQTDGCTGAVRNATSPRKGRIIYRSTRPHAAVRPADRSIAGILATPRRGEARRRAAERAAALPARGPTDVPVRTGDRLTPSSDEDHCQRIDCRTLLNTINHNTSLVIARIAPHLRSQNDSSLHLKFCKNVQDLHSFKIFFVNSSIRSENIRA